MLRKAFKMYHAAIENSIMTSWGSFALNDKLWVQGKYSSNLALALRHLFKRSIDLVFSGLLICFSLPLFVIIALTIKLTSKGPVFFRQERVGFRGKKFKICKFRTMVHQDSENEHKKYVEALLKEAESSDNTEMLQKYAEYLDKRITKVGQFLRISSLDELPQFFNVWLGQMSLVGPRPHPTYEVNSYKKWYIRRLDIKPGLTGWSKLNLRLTPQNYEEAILYDLWYVDNWSIGLDLRILIMTIPFVLSTKDAT